MNPSELLSDQFTVRWDASLDSFVIVHPDPSGVPGNVVQIRSSTLADMSFTEASQFIGERLVLLMPSLRKRYVDESTGLVRDPKA